MIVNLFWLAVFLFVVWIFLCRRWAAGQARIYGGWRSSQSLPRAIDAFPRTAWKSHFYQAWQSGTGGLKVFSEDLGDWPTVRKIEGKADTYRIEARYPSPRSMKQANFWAVIAAIAFFGWFGNRLTSQPSADPSLSLGPWLFAGVVGLISYAVFRALFRATFWRLGQPMKMTIEGARTARAARIEWTGDEQKRQWRFNPKAVVLPTEKRQYKVAAPHRKAAQELRKNQERQQQRKKPLPMHYQQCSEVLIVSGPSLAKWQQVAEISKDEFGQKAGTLTQAISYVARAAQGTLAELQTLEQEDRDFEE